MSRQENGFTLLEILVALVITAMTLVAVNQLVSSAVRAQKTADATATAATLADMALEYALLPTGINDTGLQELVQHAQASGWNLVITHSPAPIPAFESVSVTVSGNALERPFEIQRFVRVADYAAGEE